jgi:phosphohistidine phosphatase
MKLVLVRHGEASFDAPSDRLRELTDVGRENNKRVAGSMHTPCSSVNVFWTSDLLRAQQSGEAFTDIVAVKPEQQRFLSPESDPKRVIAALEKLNPEDEVLIVAHQPLLGSLVSHLCHGHGYEPHPFITSEALILECEIPALGLATVLEQFLP